MLVLHKSSTCDICMEDYDLENLSKSPHVIDCGHILCLTCVTSLESAVCPLCRGDFAVANLMKLHVNAPGLDHTDPVNAQAMFILERIALASSDECAKEDVLTVMTEVNTWLCEQPDADDETSNITVRSALFALCRLKAHEYRDDPDLTDELETARGVEQSLHTLLESERRATETLRNELEDNLRDTHNVLQNLRAENDRLNKELKEQKSTMENLHLRFHTNLQDVVGSLETSRVAELNLLANIKEKETKHVSKLGAAESEIAFLRAEVSHLRTVVNALRPSPLQPLLSTQSSQTFSADFDSTRPTMSDSPVRSNSPTTPLTDSRNGHLHSSLSYMLNSSQSVHNTSGDTLTSLDVTSSSKMKKTYFSNMPEWQAGREPNISTRTKGLRGDANRPHKSLDVYDIISPRIQASHQEATHTIPVDKAHEKSGVADETLELSGGERAGGVEKKPRRTIADRMLSLQVSGLPVGTTKHFSRSLDQSTYSADRNSNVEASSSQCRLDGQPYDEAIGGIRSGWNFWA